MFKRIIAATILMAGLTAPHISMAEQPEGCAETDAALSQVEGGIEAIRKKTGVKGIDLETQFVQIPEKGKKTEGEFRVYVDSGGQLKVDSNLGDFKTIICRTNNGIQAHIFLKGFEAMVAGTDHVVLTLVGKKNGIVEMTDNLPDKKGDAPSVLFKPVF